MSSCSEFQADCYREIVAQGADERLLADSRNWLNCANKYKYSYHFSWCGRPIIQYPQDIIAMQELIWSIRPDLILETGIARGGSVIFYASMLAQLDICDAIDARKDINPSSSKRLVLGIDIDIREQNRNAVEAHPMASRIQMLQGSSVAPEIVDQVKRIAANYERILVCLDSNHTHDHVLAELEAYALLTSIGSYCVVFDTIIDDMPANFFPDRPWGPANNPKTAVREYLKAHPEFDLDKSIPEKLLITVAPDGFLRRIK